MPRLKKRIKKQPSTPFIIKLEAAVLKDGFESVKAFVMKHIYKGNTFKSLHDVIEEKYKINVCYLTTVRNLRKYAPRSFNRRTRFHFKRKAAAARKDGEERVGLTYFVNEKIKNGWTQIRIAKALNMSNKHLKQILSKMYPIDFEGKELFPDMARFGMTKTYEYYRWLIRARRIGFESVTDAIDYLLFERKIPFNEVAFVFGVSPLRLLKRIKKCEYLCKKQTTKGENYVTESNCRTDV